MVHLKQLPNVISFSRLLGIPILVWMLLGLGKEYAVSSSLFFLALAFTDLLDGYLARRLRAVTELGALLDPLVDKLLIIAPLIAMVGMRSSGSSDSWVPAWLVILLVARELWITGLRGFAVVKGVVISASELGKAKTFFQVLGVFFLILHDVRLFEFADIWVTAQYVGIQCLITAVLVGYWGGAEYTYAFFSAKPVLGPFEPDGKETTSLRLRLRAR